MCPSNNSNGKDLTVLFKMNLSRAINKLSLISKLILTESFDKMIELLKFMLQSQVSKSSELADYFVCQMKNSPMLSSSDVFWKWRFVLP